MIGVDAGEPDTAADLRVDGVHKAFEAGRDVLADVSLSLPAGRTLALLGPSGCGKTTLLRIIAGLEAADAGTVAVGGRELTGPGRFVAPEARGVGMVFQDWALFPHLSVSGNVGFGLPRNRRRSSPEIDAALDMVGLADLGDRSPTTLSGGQQQRVALARAIAPRPRVLLLDEPFSNLDASLRARVRTEIHELLVDLGTTAVFVTHDQDEAFVLGDEVAVMNEGRIVQSGTPDDVYLRPRSRWLASFVGDADFLPATADGSAARTPLGPVELVEAAKGRVDVMVRPEHLVLTDSAAGAAPSGPDGWDSGWEGIVDLVEYVGHSTMYFVRGPDGLTLRVRVPSEPVHTRGDTVGVVHSGRPAVAFPSVPSVPADPPLSPPDP